MGFDSRTRNQEEARSKRMFKRVKWSGLALTGAAALTALSLTGLTPLPAKADPPTMSTWTEGPTAGTGSPGECLGVQGGDMTNGTPIVIWTCNGHPDQTWDIVGGSGGSGFVQLRNSQNTNKCLGVQAAATANGSKLVIWDCNASSDQEWAFVPWMADNRNGPFGCFNIRNLNASPKVIGVPNGSTTDGTQAVIWDQLSGLTHHDQVWCP
jgi:hypothetical protein